MLDGQLRYSTRSDCQDTLGLLPGALSMDALPATEITALLGRGTRFEGKLFFEGRVRIDGVQSDLVLSRVSPAVRGVQGDLSFGVITNRERVTRIRARRSRCTEHRQHL